MSRDKIETINRWNVSIMRSCWLSVASIEVWGLSMLSGVMISRVQPLSEPVVP